MFWGQRVPAGEGWVITLEREIGARAESYWSVRAAETTWVA